jgi:hypothetical protein
MPSPLEGWWAPVAQHYKREWGPQAQDTRFAAATLASPLLTLADREGVLKQRDAPPTPPQDLATAVHVCTARRCLVQNITDRTRGAYRASRYVIHSATHLIYS